MPHLPSPLPLASLPIDPGIHTFSSSSHPSPSQIEQPSPNTPSNIHALPTSTHPTSQTILPSSLPSATPASRAFGDKHDAQIIKILATIPNNPSRQAHPEPDDPKSCPLKDEHFHPVLRSQSAQSSAHLHPQLLDPPSPLSAARPSQCPSAIPTGYGSPSSGAPNGIAFPTPGASSWPLPPSVRPRTPSPTRGREPQTDSAAVAWREAGAGSGAEGSLERNSDQWKQHRKNTHKEVERRRRETINEGITELKKIVPGSEKNKGEILKQAVRYIVELKQSAGQASEQWALEKALLEQALGAQGERLGNLARQCARLEQENESLRRWIVELGEQAPARNQAPRAEPELDPLPTASCSGSEKREPESQDRPSHHLTEPTPNGDTQDNHHTDGCSKLDEGPTRGSQDGDRDDIILEKACKKTRLR